MTALFVAADGTITIPEAAVRAMEALPGDRLVLVLAGSGAAILERAEGTTAADPRLSTGTIGEAEGEEPMSTGEFMLWLDRMAGVVEEQEHDPG